ncbi:type VII secretion target [Kitasatospora sp. NPDC088134]|uniref:type VII secretion target n=1 Tax=Kitasatospora sp. NPDC088134 TaxID=3364071 RepID=UPI00381BFBAB
MAGEFTVDPDTLRRFARTSTERAERLRAIRAELGGHQLSPSAFGKLPEADATARDYAERSEAAIENTGAGADTMDRIAEYADGMAAAYERADEGTARAMTAIAGGPVG